jgi:uncharacterized protein DUF1064
VRVKRPHKYGAKATVVDGIRFASQKEARRYGELKLLEKAGHIHDVEVQPSFDLLVWRGKLSTKVGVYRADFRYCQCESPGQCEGEFVVEDVKGVRTPVYRLKKKHVEAQYGITVVEI